MDKLSYFNKLCTLQEKHEMFIIVIACLDVCFQMSGSSNVLNFGTKQC